MKAEFCNALFSFRYSQPALFLALYFVVHTAEKVASRRARIWSLARISLELFLQKYKDPESNSVLGRNSFFFRFSNDFQFFQTFNLLLFQKSVLIRLRQPYRGSVMPYLF